MAKAEDGHRWVHQDGRVVYLAPGESEPQYVTTQRVAPASQGSIDDEQEAKSEPKA